jgi:hypothetical protein
MFKYIKASSVLSLSLQIEKSNASKQKLDSSEWWFSEEKENHKSPPDK